MPCSRHHSKARRITRDVRAQPAIEYFDRVQFGIRRFLPDGAGHCGAMPKPVDRILTFCRRTFCRQSNFHRTGNFPNVRMSRMNAAIDNRDLHAACDLYAAYGSTAIPA